MEHEAANCDSRVSHESVTRDKKFLAWTIVYLLIFYLC